MKKIILLLLFLPVLAFAQKIKTKKDRILFDDKEVAILDDKVRDQYILKDLTGKTMFIATYKAIADGTTILNQWVEVTSPDGGITTEIPYDVLITSFSPSRIMLQLLSAKYELLGASGFDKEKIDRFFATKRESISDKSLRAKADVIAQRQEKQGKVAQYNPIVKYDGTVLFGGNAGTNIVGRAVSSPYSAFGDNNTATVFDLDGVTVATAHAKGGMNNDVVVTLYNETDFTYQAEKRFAGGDNVSFLTELIGELVYRDVTLGHQARIYKSDLLKEKTKLAKERSHNIYSVPGYAIDEKGVRYDGIITAQFEKLDIHQTGNTEVVDAIDKYGKSVSVKYSNAQGKERTITLSSKDNVSFGVRNADGSFTVYEGMKVKGDSAKKLSNAMLLGFNNAYFYKVLFSEAGNAVLVDPIEEDRFVIKLKSSESGQMIDSRNNENVSRELSEYVGTCPMLAREIKEGAFDLKISENLVTIVKEFNECK
ncbi:MAG TPA: hypothetical protein VF676_00240 [Flavobacterium sp.]|jgi:hypothetical protein